MALVPTRPTRRQRPNWTQPQPCLLQGPLQLSLFNGTRNGQDNRDEEKVTVITLFTTADSTTDGDLTEIRCFWAQDGVGCEGFEHQFHCLDRNPPHVRILRRADNAFWSDSAFVVDP